MAATDISTGITLVFGTSGFSAEITSITLDPQEVEPVDVSHMGTTGFREYIFTKLTDPGGISFDMHYDPDEDLPTLGTAETITLTFATPSGGLTGANISGTGAMISHSAEAPLEGVMTASAVIKFDGKTGPTVTDST